DHDVLMIDEALATGDRSFQVRSENRIKELREKAGTVFLVSHNNKSIRDTCDRVLWLEKGELLMDGPTEEVVSAYEKATNG
ncbi:ABC transporter ATP-binding protein, partial [Streptomyces sp. WAC05950]